MRSGFTVTIYATHLTEPRLHGAIGLHKRDTASRWYVTLELEDLFLTKACNGPVLRESD